MNIPAVISQIRARANISQERLAQIIGVSFVSINRWERGASTPSPAQVQRILELQHQVDEMASSDETDTARTAVFASRGIRRQTLGLPLFEGLLPQISLSKSPLPPILSRIHIGKYFLPSNELNLQDMLEARSRPARTVAEAFGGGISAGKNTYTYDAHTYHTKVPPQGISELLKYYLPEGGLVLDPFAGSGMTGVAARASGYDCILNELSPAACFIANRFTTFIEPEVFQAGVTAVLDAVGDIRQSIYTTTCRECSSPTEILYTVWSYRVTCSNCEHEFQLWDHCRQYGKRVRDHKILSEFPCPSCEQLLTKSRLRRTVAEAVQIGYKCCGSRQQEVTHVPDAADLEKIQLLEASPPLAEGFYPMDKLPDGVNLRQPKSHGLHSIDRFYTARNLIAMSHLWKTIHHVADVNLAAHLAFVFTSLYQRVTRLSEFRFWGGSGNTARYNVPFIFNEANVFLTFARKARTIRDHLEATASHYTGQTVVVQNSATSLNYLPSETIDFIFTDPPFGANINYSDMNFLWEAWLGKYTDTTDEAIMNKAQGKDIEQYQQLMTTSFKEAYRVLRENHWMLVVFMNSSSQVWSALKQAIEDAGFYIVKADIFDKHHATFKQLVSENTAGQDLVLHCLKPHHTLSVQQTEEHTERKDNVLHFLHGVDFSKRRNVYLHTSREAEVDFRTLYSEWIAQAIVQGIPPIDFAEFRKVVEEWLASPG